MTKHRLTSVFIVVLLIAVMGGCGGSSLSAPEELGLYLSPNFSGWGDPLVSIDDKEADGGAIVPIYSPSFFPLSPLYDIDAFEGRVYEISSKKSHLFLYAATDKIPTYGFYEIRRKTFEYRGGVFIGFDYPREFCGFPVIQIIETRYLSMSFFEPCRKVELSLIKARRKDGAEVYMYRFDFSGGTVGTEFEFEIEGMGKYIVRFVS